MSEVAAALEQIQQRNEHDYSDRRQERRLMNGNDRPPFGALTWTYDDMSAKGKLIRQWRKACFWKFRELAVRSVTAVLADFISDSGYAFPGNTALENECFVSRQRIDKALTRLERGGAIIRVYSNEGYEKPLRRIYPARAVVAEFEKECAGSSKAKRGAGKHVPAPPA